MTATTNTPPVIDEERLNALLGQAVVEFGATVNAALVVIGVAALTVMNTSNALMQLSTEPAMRGRVMALRLGVALGGTPIGAPIVGWVADHFGPRWALGIGAAAGFAAAIIAIGMLSRHAHENRFDLPQQR